MAVGLPATADRGWAWFDFKKKIEKLAVGRADAARMLCVCHDRGLCRGIAGWLESKLEIVPPDGDLALGVLCPVPTYDPVPLYELDTYGGCLEFEVLSR
ncbi:MAG: hypothetical protein JRG85_10520 [Deltaproteobacteria bacterium]|nr:hypothetical protein [Deltaproteobacteria bacterium]